MSDDKDAAKLAVKRLTKRIESSLITLTINAPDWETLYAGRMARDLLWEDSKKLNLDDFVPVSQTSVMPLLHLFQTYIISCFVVWSISLLIRTPAHPLLGSRKHCSSIRLFSRPQS